MADEKQIMEHQSRLGIMPKQSMDAGQGMVSSAEPTIAEILTKVNNAKDKPKKIKVLQENNSEALRMIQKVLLTLISSGHYQVVHHLTLLTKHL